MLPNGTKIIFKNLGEILKGVIVSQGEDVYIVRSTRGKNYAIQQDSILRRIF